jgi:hypothetical protein
MEGGGGRTRIPSWHTRTCCWPSLPPPMHNNAPGPGAMRKETRRKTRGRRRALTRDGAPRWAAPRIPAKLRSPARDGGGGDGV